ncbi:MAG TPA: hypothetical protein VEA41_02435, partial [Salinarimonas sp.]|nr:hypothetical protein [Salinarimonas sp.]
MRDILTVLAVLLILALTAAVAAPPFVAWEAHRAALDRGIARAAGMEARTEGAVAIRLLPTPRIRLERLHLGPEEGPSLDLADLASEIALGALLRGEVRFLNGEAERAELRLRLSPDGRIALPPVPAEALAGQVAFEDMAIGQLVLTGIDPATGRTEQVRAEAVRVSGASLAGPWRATGRVGGIPLRLASGLPGRDGAVPVRISGGGGAAPRLDLDLRLAFDHSAAGVAPLVSGTGRLVAGPPGSDADGVPVPLQAAAEIRSQGRSIALDNLTVEIGEATRGVRLTGSGVVDAGAPAIRLALEGRRLDLDALLGAPGAAELRARLVGDPPRPPWPVTVDLALGSVAYAGEEVSDLRLAGRLGPEGPRLERLALAAPGQSTISIAGDGGTGAFSGEARIASREPDRLGAFLTRIGASSPLIALLSGPAFEARAAIVSSPPLVTLRDLRLETGGATVTGALRYTGRDGGAPARLDAQIAGQGLDLAALPGLDRIAGLAGAVDLGLTLEARDIRVGGAGSGRVVARVVSEGADLRIEELQVEDLAGVEARVSGRLMPDGSGRIEGRVRARRAAPLLDLLAGLAPDAPLALAPAFVREGSLDLALTADGGAGSRDGRVALRGTLADGPFEGELRRAGGATESLSASLRTADSARWLGQAHPLVAGKPSSLALRAVRAGPERLSVTAQGELAGLRAATVRAFAYHLPDGVLEGGEATLATSDLRPALLLLRLAPGAAPVPADLRLSLSRAGAVAT